MITHYVCISYCTIKMKNMLFHNLCNINLINLYYLPNPGGNVLPECSSLSFPCTFSISRLRNVLRTGLYKFDFTPASFVLGRFSDSNFGFSLSVLLD